jgi:four helix bundle protein
MEGNLKFQDSLKLKMDKYVNLVYKLTKKFPKDELFGVTSQLRRAALSIILNFIEGYARNRNKVYLQFLDISYGSLKESKYLIYFSWKQGYIAEKEYNEANNLSEEIGKMLWRIIESRRKQ